MRLKATEVAAWRARVLAEQGGRCDLCGQPITEAPVADHNHKNGSMRAVLHRGCNAMLGHLENNRPRHGLTDPVKFARFLFRVATYLTQHNVSPRPELHPSFKDAEQKRVSRNKKAVKARASKKKATE